MSVFRALYLKFAIESVLDLKDVFVYEHFDLVKNGNVALSELNVNEALFSRVFVCVTDVTVKKTILLVWI